MANQIVYVVSETLVGDDWERSEVICRSESKELCEKIAKWLRENNEYEGVSGVNKVIYHVYKEVLAPMVSSFEEFVAMWE